jgi:hypothetical protein
MKLKGPILTLAAGLVLAVVLMVLNLRVTGQRNAADSAPPDAAAVDTTATTAPPTTKPPAKPAAPVTYAGWVKGGGATIAIVVKEDKAVAYLCDGSRTEAWLQGTADNGELVLKGSGNASLAGTFGNGKAEGSVTASGRRFSFAVKVVKPPSGLYRATAQALDAVGGWVVFEDDEGKVEQVGMLTVGGEQQPAEPLNLDNPTTDVNGTTIPADQVDPTAGL